MTSISDRRYPDVDFFIYLGFYNKIYDSTKLDCYETTENNKLLISQINNNILPLSVYDKIYKNIQGYPYLDKINEIVIKNKNCKIYSDNYGDFRKIIIAVDGRAVFVCNLRYST